MKRDDSKTTGADTRSRAEELELEAFLKGVEPPPQPDAETKAQAATQLKADWQLMVRQRRRRRYQRFGALAASIVLALGLMIVVPALNEPDWSAQLAAGGIEVDSAELHGPARLQISPDTTWKTRQPARLVLANGVDLRLAVDTSVTWLTPDRLVLHDGALYVDTFSKANLVVETRLGTIRDIGTRFLVSLDDTDLEVAVRQGAAELSTSTGAYLAKASPGEAALLLSRDAIVSSRVEPASAERWGWIHSVPRGYSDRTVATVLEAIAQDLGRPVSFVDETLHMRLRRDRVQGDLKGLDPHLALELVARSAELSWREQSNLLVIDRSG